MTCISACPTQDHKSWGACRRSNSLNIGYARSATNHRNDLTAEKKWTRELDAYASARKQGIQPDSTKRRDVEHAIKQSDLTGQAYGYRG